MKLYLQRQKWILSIADRKKKKKKERKEEKRKEKKRKEKFHSEGQLLSDGHESKRLIHITTLVDAKIHSSFDYNDY